MTDFKERLKARTTHYSHLVTHTPHHILHNPHVMILLLNEASPLLQHPNV